MLYSSIKNDRVKNLKKLSNKKYRDEVGLFIVEGDHLVREAYKSGCLKEIYILEGKDIDIDVNKNYVTSDVMKYISNLDSYPIVIGVCRKIDGSCIKGDKILLLDNIQDPGNLGTIIRSALAFNVDTLVLSNDTVDLYNEKVIRATQGMIFRLNIIRCDLLEVIGDLKEDNYHIYTTNVNYGNSLKDIERCKKIAIIMGNEGMGVKEELSLLADSYLYIDMNKNCESLNVAIATSIILYELDK